VVQGTSIWAISSGYALGDAYSGRPLVLTDLRSGERRLLPWPSDLDVPDEAAVHPDGRRVAVGFGEFVPREGNAQLTDVWLLDTVTGEFVHLPDMPAAVDLKRSRMTWTRDGRLVWLADTGGRTVVAAWRPGDNRIQVRPVLLPVRNGGSDTFVAWVKHDR
jgi:hypothetical protein